MFHGTRPDYYGSTVIGEKGQIVIPAEIRKKYEIDTGDKFLVLAGERKGTWGIILVKSDVVSMVVESMFGGKLQELLDALEEGDDE